MYVSGGYSWGVQELVRESWAKGESQTTEFTRTGSKANAEDPQIDTVHKQESLSETNRSNMAFVCSSGGGHECEGRDDQHSIHSSTNDLPDVMASNACTSCSSLVKHVCERKREASPTQVHIDSSSTASGYSIFEYIELSPAALSSDSKADSPALLELFASQEAGRSQTPTTPNPKQMEEGLKHSVSKESVYSLSPGMVEAVACSSVFLDDSELGFSPTSKTFSKCIM